MGGGDGGAQRHVLDEIDQGVVEECDRFVERVRGVAEGVEEGADVFGEGYAGAGAIGAGLHGGWLIREIGLSYSPGIMVFGMGSWGLGGVVAVEESMGFGSGSFFGLTLEDELIVLGY